MKHKGFYLTLAGCIVALAALVCWLIFGGKMPTRPKPTKGVTVAATVKNTTITRDENGKKLWEFQVKEAVQDNKNKRVSMRGVTGKVYRKDGSYIDIKGDRGLWAMETNNFVLAGNVEAVHKNGSKLTTDRVHYDQKTEVIIATGNVVMTRDNTKVTGDKAETTSAFKNVKVTGHAKAEKGGM